MCLARENLLCTSGTGSKRRKKGFIKQKERMPTMVQLQAKVHGACLSTLRIAINETEVCELCVYIIRVPSEKEKEAGDNQRER